MKKLYFFLLFTLTTTAQQVTTITGFMGSGFADGPLATAQFSAPSGLCADPTGTILYVAERFNNRIRKIDLTTNMVSTIAGSTVGYADGIGTAALFKGPSGICMDSNGNLFVTDDENHKIRKIDLATNTVTTFAGSTQGYVNGTGTTAKFNYPTGICIDSNNNLYVTEDVGNKIRKITSTGQVTNYAGSGVAGFADGVGTTAQFNSPQGICIDALNNIFVADAVNFKIRKITPDRTVTTIAGTTYGYLDGPIATAKLRSLKGICLDTNNNLYVADNDVVIRKLNLTDSIVSTFIDLSSVNGDPNSMCFINNTIYFTEFGQCKIKKITDVLDIENFENYKIIIFYNKNTNNIIIDSNFDFNKVNIYNLLGKEIINKEIVSNNNIELNCNNLTKGLYIVKIITNENTTIIKKIIVN